MGFTYYFRRDKNLDPALFAQAAEDCKKVMGASGVLVAFEYDQAGKPAEFSNKLIRFNGIGEDGHETFYFERDFQSEAWQGSDKQGKYFEFCKTARKPYDLPVTACLIVLKHHLGQAVRVSSDGDSSDWDAARQLCKRVLGYGEIHLSR